MSEGLTFVVVDGRKVGRYKLVWTSATTAELGWPSDSFPKVARAWQASLWQLMELGFVKSVEWSDAGACEIETVGAMIGWFEKILKDELCKAPGVSVEKKAEWEFEWNGPLVRVYDGSWVDIRQVVGFRMVVNDDVQFFAIMTNGTRFLAIQQDMAIVAEKRMLNLLREARQLGHLQ